MISSVGGVPGWQPYMRLLDSLDSDKNQSVSLDELKAARPTEAEEKVKATFGKLDSDGDGKIGRAEMVAAAFDNETLKALVDLQGVAGSPTGTAGTDKPSAPETSWAPPRWTPDSRMPDTVQRPAYEKTDDEKAATAALFARADLDGDGLLSEDEFKVERALTRENTLKTGNMPQTSFMPHDQNGDNLISQDEVDVGHILTLKPENIRFFGEMSADEQDAAIAERENTRTQLADFNAKFPGHAVAIPPPLKRESAETAQAKRAAYEAEYAERLSAPEGYYKLSESQLQTIQATAQPIIDTPALSDLLAQRLMRDSLASLTPDPSALVERITA